MKKNRMMRLASALLVAVLLTTCAISGTFAKYVTTASATDEARVAKWGVTVTATGDAFEEKYNDAANVAGTKVVSSVTGKDVLAPGTNGPLASLAITGTPEVMVNVAVTATLDLDGWVIDEDDDPATPDVEYCPIVFTIGTETYGTNDTTATNKYATISDLEAAVVAKFTALNKSNVEANTNLAASVGATWDWDFDDNDDVKDTLLGNLAADDNAPTIKFACEATVTQVD